MSRTPVVGHWEIPAGSVWCIGQHTKEERAALDKRARSGELVKVRAAWCGCGPLKMVYVRST